MSVIRGVRATSSADDPEAEALGLLLANALALLQEQSTLQDEGGAGDAGLTRAQLRTLLHLRSHGSHSISSMAERLRLSLAATSHLIDKLVRGGLIDRHEDPTNRRQKRVELNGAGTQVLEEVARGRALDFMPSIRRLELETRRQLESSLLLLIRDLRPRSGPPIESEPPPHVA